MNKNNLNRIKGILSAKQGIQIPKFQEGAKFVRERGNRLIYSADGTNWFYDQNLTQNFNGNLEKYGNELQIGTKDSVPAGVNFITQNQIDNINKKNKIAGNSAQFTGQALQTVGNILAAQQSTTDSDVTKGIDYAVNGIANAIPNEGLGFGIKTIAALGDIAQGLYGKTDQKTTADKILDSSIFGSSLGLINNYFGKESDKFNVDLATQSKIGSSYTGTYLGLEDTEKLEGKYGLVSSKKRNEADKEIAKANELQRKMQNISKKAETQQLAASTMGEQTALAYSRMVDGGYDQKYTYAAKKGGVLEHEIIDWEVPAQIIEWELPTLLEWGLPTFKEGGNVNKSIKNSPEIKETTQKNVIPEGALHKNKHHMEHTEGLTKKGIPVIDNDGEQQAEIEREEFTMTLELTKFIEDYYNKFYNSEYTKKEKDEFARIVGEKLVYEILENTDDRIGLIDSCKNGGSIKLKKSVDDILEEPQSIIIEETVVTIKEEDPIKKQIKEAVKEVLLELIIK